MYGRGNYPPQFRQGLQRPMPPPYQQSVAGHPSVPHFQPGNSVPLQPVMQQGGPPPRGVPPHGPFYLRAPHAPPNMLHLGRPPISTPNINQPYLHLPPPPYIGSQQNFVTGSQNSQPPLLPPPSMGHIAPPPLLSMQLPPPPPIAVGFFPPKSVAQPSAETQTHVVGPQPPPSSPPRVPPPPPSRLETQSGHDPVTEQVILFESLGNNTTYSQKNVDTLNSKEDMSLKQSDLLGLPPPPPKPANENVVRNIEVLCQFIAKNGPEFEEMARKHESGNPEFNFLVGDDLGSEAASAHEYFLWMKKKCTFEHVDQGQRGLRREADVQPSSELNALPSVGATRSPVDSDVDMEDDITQFDKEHGVYNSIEDAEQEPVLTGNTSEMQKQENGNELHHLKDNSSALDLSQSVKLEAGAESKPENPIGEPTDVHSPFRLIQNYASDDSSDDGEQCHENVKVMVVSPIGKSRDSHSQDAMEYFNKESVMELGQSVTTCSESRLTKVRDDLHCSKQHHEADKHESCDMVSQTRVERNLEEGIDDAAQPSVSHQEVEKLAAEGKTSVGSVKRDQVPGASDEPISHLPICEDQLSAGVPLTTEQVMTSSKIDSSTVETSIISPPGTSVNEPCLDKTTKESITPNACAPNFSLQISHLPTPPVPQQASNAPQNPNLLVDYNYMAPSGRFPPQSVTVGSGPLYQTPLPNQQSHNPLPPNLAWSTLPEPHPPHMLGPAMAGNPLQFQYGNLVLRNDFPGQMSLRAHQPSHSHVGGFSHQTYHLPSSNSLAQPFSSSNLTRDDRYPQFPTQSSVPSSSFFRGVAPQPVPFQGDSTVKSTQSIHEDNLLVGESSKPFFQNHQFVQQRLPPYGPQLTSSESLPIHGGSLSVTGYSSNLVDGDNSSNFSDVGGTRMPAYYNPYASTFDQPLSTRFSSIAFDQGRDAATGIQYDDSFGVVPAAIDGQLSGNPSSRRIVSSSNSSKADGQTVLKSGGNQYDPLFDSIDPKLAPKQDHAADNSDIMLKRTNHHDVLVVEENNKQKLVGAESVAVSASPENDEFGETADAEVGAVENGSPSNPNGDAYIAEGDIEIDQVKPEGRKKKSKDSRSMKLFKVAVAKFVKDILKPQWRQGNMSKEVFKTVVKKTVDKVSGAMKNHRLPKSQAKVDHYIDSSRRKLTQLVEGYVSKYKN